MSIRKRKGEHVDIVVNKDVSFKTKTTGFECIEFVHRGATRLKIDEIDISTTFLEKHFKAPLLIGCMTGGYEDAERINRGLARIAQKLGIGMCVGSQRAALNHPELAYTFSVVREEAPDIFVMGNLGAAQLKEYGMSGIRKAIEMIKADAIAIHFNPVQEAVQIEGTPDFSEWFNTLSDVSKDVGIPIIAKEIGFGFSYEDAVLLKKVGVSGIEIDGAGGTSWAAVEYYRAETANDKQKMELAKLFWDWGIPTAASLCEVLSHVDLPVIAGGGIKNGIEVAKALSLGASLVAIARPILKELIQGGIENAADLINKYILELRTTMFLVEAKNILQLQRKPLIIRDWLKTWLESRGINTMRWSSRSDLNEQIE
ncbi:MAG: type 2 isopentenyl-diphosphate Delta-isomerase [Thermoprotei archaeon]